MKTYIFIIWIMVFPIVMQAQYSWERYTISASGGAQNTSTMEATTAIQHYEATSNISSSYSGNTGFLFPQNIQLDIVLDIKALLEGPFHNSGMRIDINGILPLSQPYNTSPWNYNGTESVTAIPNGNIVDWVLVELRDATDATSANSSTLVERQAAFLLKNGVVVGLDGSSTLTFTHSLIHSLFVIIKHRNHLAIMSANPLINSGGVYSYDFSTNANQAWGNNQNNLEGKYGLIGGDANADGAINEFDKNNSWLNQIGHMGYLESDANMDSQVDNQDKNDVLLKNSGKTEILP